MSRARSTWGFSSAQALAASMTWGSLLVTVCLAVGFSSGSGSVSPAEAVVVAVAALGGALGVGALLDLAIPGLLRHPGDFLQGLVHVLLFPRGPFRRHEPSLPVHHAEDSPLSVVHLSHLFQPAAVEAYLHQVSRVYPDDAVLPGPPAPYRGSWTCTPG